MALTATKLSEADDHVRAMYYGTVGTGKTTDLAFMAQGGPTLFINRESGLKKRPLIKLGVKVDNIRVMNPDTYADIEEAFWALKTGKKLPYGVCWDSLTDTQQGTMTEITEAKAKSKAARGYDHDPFHATQDDWQKGNEQMRRLVRRFRDLPCHLAVAALERRDVDEDTGNVRYGPALTPGIAEDIAGYMDIVCFCRVKEVAGVDEFQGIVRPVGNWMAKDRFNALPRTLIDPTFDRILAYVEDRLTVETDEVMQEARARRETLSVQDRQEADENGDSAKPKGAAKKKVKTA